VKTKPIVPQDLTVVDDRRCKFRGTALLPQWTDVPKSDPAAAVRQMTNSVVRVSALPASLTHHRPREHDPAVAALILLVVVRCSLRSIDHPRFFDVETLILTSKPNGE
jgi:hypothetical protein